jgi:hypothetical protein
MSIQSGVGHSQKKNAESAGQEAAFMALKKIGDVKPEVVLVFSSPSYDHAQLLKGISKVTKKIPLLGGTTAGETSNLGTLDDSVVIALLGSKEGKNKFLVGLGENFKESEEKCAQNLVKNILKGKKLKAKNNSLIIFPDGLSGDGSKLIQGLQNQLGEDFEIVGGYLGDKADFKKTYQFFNYKVYENSIPGLLISGDFISSTGVRSGFDSIGNKFECTKSKGNIVFEFDHQPALSFYQELLGPERAKKLPGVALEYPFGVIDEKALIAGKEYFQLRCALSVDEKNQSMALAASIPQGKKVTLTTASRAKIIEGAKLAAEQAKANLKKNPGIILFFSCVGRKIVLGKQLQDEVKTIQKVFPPNTPIIGFYTYGEIGPIDKSKPTLKATRFHNETAVLWVA